VQRQSAACSSAHTLASLKMRTNVAAKIMKEGGMENVMFEAANPQVFESCIKNYGVDVNLFIDHSQTEQLECLRRDI
jgi:phosphosulfolactate synthase (CoM biosynthesis protein A)